ncbi:lantibiotic dehydratase [Spirosoma jeollabukense]
MLINALNFYVLRVPALPLLIVAPVQEQSNIQLQSLWDDGKLSEALFVSSPSLHQQITDHLCTKGWPLPSNLHRTLWKYALRMSTRATPFGLMAGCSVGTVTKTTQVTFDTQTRFVPHHRLDIVCVAQIVRELVKKPAIRSQLRFFPTNASYLVGDELRYIEHDDTGSERHYFTASVTASAPLMAVLQRAQTGATPAQLAEPLMTAGINSATAATFVDQLIEQQLLVSDLEPMLTGPSLLTQLQSRLQQLVGTDLLVENLADVETQLATGGINASMTYRTVQQALTRNFSVSSPQPLIQTDSFVNTSVNQLNRRVLQTILGQVERLLPLNRPRQNAKLVSFAQRFRDRYEDRTVPLLVALDAELGIGYAEAVGATSDYSFLLDGLTFATTPEPNAVTWGRHENLLVEVLSRALCGRQLSVELKDDDIAPLNTTDASTLPCSFYLFGNLLGTSPEAVDQGDFQFNLLAAEGPSAANLLGRFGSHSPSLTDHVRSCLQREEQQRPDVIYAEIIHWPSNRVGNILQRPILRQFEIPLVSRASVGEGNQLMMSDLLVSVRSDGRVCLWSKRHQKEVIPRLSTAHNYRAGLSLYQFLADLQRQDCSLSLYWDWGPLRDQIFLPRITYRNLILSRARWTLRSKTLPLLSTDVLISHLRTVHQLPRWVALADGDNELVLDLETDLGQQLLADEVRRQPTVHLVEWVTTPEQSWLRDGQGAYVNEVVIPCELLPSPLKKAAFVRPINQQYGIDLPVQESVGRSFHPGSEWLYIKLYSGVQIADELLKELIFPFVQKLLAEGTVQNWFFIRYADPDPHLRLRLQGTTLKFHGQVLDRLHEWTEPYRKSGVIYRVQIDTYERELDRYGASIITETESIFGADSWATLRYLAQEADPADRWQFALQSCDTLLVDFELGNQEKASLLRQLQEQFLAEHQADRTLRQQLNARFRSEHEQITLSLSNCSPTAYESMAILAERSVRLRSLVRCIMKKRSTSVDHPSLSDLLASYLHMNLNRLFASQQRTQEMVIYHFLARYYESYQARQLIK